MRFQARDHFSTTTENSEENFPPASVATPGDIPKATRSYWSTLDEVVMVVQAVQRVLIHSSSSCVFAFENRVLTHFPSFRIPFKLIRRSIHFLACSMTMSSWSFCVCISALELGPDPSMESDRSTLVSALLEKKRTIPRVSGETGCCTKSQDV